MCGRLQDSGLRRAGQRWRAGRRGPDVGLQEAQELLCFLGGLEVQLDHDVLGFTRRAEDAVPLHSSTLTLRREGVEWAPLATAAE